MSEGDRIDYVAAVDRAMESCPICETWNAPQRETHRRRTLEDILRKQSQPFTPLPPHVWPDGHPPT